MNLLQLLSHLRYAILDDIGGTGVDWQSYDEEEGRNYLRWTNEELTTYINEAEREVARRLHCIRDASTSSICDITTVSGTRAYTLSDKILTVENVYISAQDSTLDQVSYRQLLKYGDWKTETGLPEVYYTDFESSKIGFWPVPGGAYSINMLVTRYPSSDLSWDDPTESPEIESKYHVKMLWYAAHLAYLKDEADSYDPERSLQMLNLFDSEFGINESYLDEERSKVKSRGRTKFNRAWGGIATARTNRRWRW